MLTAFGIYALMLAAWGAWHARGAASDGDAEAAEPSAPAVRHERGTAARRHLSTLP